jgi:hypothetical protein
MTGRSAPRSWTRWLRLSVQRLMILVLLTGGWLGWLARSARIQSEAVRTIEKVGGKVYYDWEWKETDTSIWISQGGPWAPRWLVRIVGVDYFGHVIRVELNVDDEWKEGLAAASRLYGVERLTLGGQFLGAKKLAYLKAFRSLKGLTFLGEFQLTDAGLANLKGLTSLEKLDTSR